ncbi:MAG: hypothetical protein ABSH49_05900 [Bryobacteraceae bacterium]
MTTYGGLEIARPDPLLCHLELPLRRTYYPVGFRLHLATNSREVVNAADACWGEYPPEFAFEPLQMRVVVEANGGPACQPTFRLQGHLMSAVSDAHNFAVVDFHSLLACIYVSKETAADRSLMRWCFLESTAGTLLAQRYVAPLHAATVARNGTGVLLCGASGAGKSTLSFAAASQGWTFVSDDCTWLLISGSDAIAIGRPHHARFRDDAPSLFPRLARYNAHERPNGKITIEVPMRAFPEIRTALRSKIGGLAWLDRRRGRPPAIKPVAPAEVVRELLNSASYGSQVDAMHENATKRLLDLPACRLQYESLDDGLRLFAEFAAGIGAA